MRLRAPEGLPDAVHNNANAVQNAERVEDPLFVDEVLCALQALAATVACLMACCLIGGTRKSLLILAGL